MITDQQREQAKAHGFHFYERMAGRADDPAAVVEAKPLDSLAQVRSTLHHLVHVCHHPAFIAVDLLCAVADREGSPRFRAACQLIKDEHARAPRQQFERALRLLADTSEPLHA